MSSENRPTSGGVEITDELIEKLASEAEKGYDLDKVRSGRRRGRPSLGSGPSSLFQVRLSRVLRERLFEAARQSNLSPSQWAREALEVYLDVLQPPGDSNREPQRVATQTVIVRNETREALAAVAKSWGGRNRVVRTEYLAGVILERVLPPLDRTKPVVEPTEPKGRSSPVDEPLDEPYRNWRQPALFAGRAA